MSSENRANRAEINRLNKAIAQEEQNINAIFQRMGQIYFAAHQDAPEEAQKENVTAVRMAMDRAKQIKDHINFLRGITLCPTCRAEVSINAAFCSCCGTRMPVRTVPAPAAVEARICPNCGNRCASGTNFCSQCGFRLPEPAAAVVPQAIPVAQPAPAPRPVPPAQPAPPVEPIPEPAPTPEPEPIPVAEEAFVSCTPMTRPEPEPMLGSLEKVVDFSPVPAPEPKPDPGLPARKICPHCGTELDPAYRFCLECGTSLL